MKYRDGYFYNPITRSTYLMRNGTCIGVYRRYQPLKCDHGYYRYPVTVKETP